MTGFDPGGDPARILDAASSFSTVATNLVKMVGEADSNVEELVSPGAWNGSAAGQFQTAWTKLSASVRDYAKVVGEAAPKLTRAATDIETAKAEIRKLIALAQQAENAKKPEIAQDYLGLANKVRKELSQILSETSAAITQVGIVSAAIAAGFRMNGDPSRPAPVRSVGAVSTGPAPATLTSVTSPATAGGGEGPSAPAPPAPANLNHNETLGKAMAAARGWTKKQWDALYRLWMRESGWSNTAMNPSSGAYGIAQALGHGPTNQYPAGPANPPQSDPRAQIEWGLNYIAQKYGTPAKAWAHERRFGWY